MTAANPKRLFEEAVQEPCYHPEHEKPLDRVTQAGNYEHECPGCGQKVTLFIPGVYCGPS